MKRHDEDARGDRSLLAKKGALRETIWTEMATPGIARFPGAEGRIPNFVGAEKAAERLRQTEVWRAAATLKCNPDSPQLPVRQRALEDGKRVYMAVPRLREVHPFFLLDPDALVGTPRHAASIRGASKSAQKVAVEDLRPVDLVVTGCVAVSEDGARLGKGGGFSDLEFALAEEAGLIGAETMVVTTVHNCQVVEAGAIPMAAHDIHLDLIVTPDRIITCARTRREASLHWDSLSEEKIASIPLLSLLASRRADD